MKTMIKTDWNERFKGKITRKQQRSRRISEIAEDVTAADCSLDFEGILLPQSPAITARRVPDL